MKSMRDRHLSTAVIIIWVILFLQKFYCFRAGRQHFNSIYPAVRYCPHLKRCQCEDGAGRLQHHTADQYGPVTVQLIKLKHYDSSPTLSLSLSVCPSHSNRAKLCWRAGCWVCQSLNKASSEGLGLLSQKAQPDLPQEWHSRTKRGCHLEHVMSPSGSGHQ